MTTPQVSIVIPTFNRSGMLRRCIDSALAQTFPCEIVVCDHGSTDDTPAAARAYGDRIRYVRREQDSGVHFAWLDGVVSARGEFVQMRLPEMRAPAFDQGDFRTAASPQLVAETGDEFESAGAQANAQQALDSIERLSKLVELYATAPAPEPLRQLRYGTFYDTTTQTYHGHKHAKGRHIQLNRPELRCTHWNACKPHLRRF